MAVAFVAERFEQATSTNATTYDSAAFTPTANSLLILCIVASDSVGTYSINSISTVSGTTLTWNPIQSREDNNGSAFQRTAMYYCLVPSSTASTVIRVTFSEGVTGIAWWIGEFSGHDTSNPILQSAAADLGTGVETHSLPSAVQTGSMTVYMFGTDRSPPAWDASADGWTEDMDTGYGTPTTGLFVAHKAEDQTITFTGTDVTPNISIIAEIQPPSSVNGNGASTMSALTQAAEGDTIVASTGAQTLTGLTQAAEGDTLVQSTGASTLPTLEQAATGGAPQINADGASALTALTQAAEGDTIVASTGASALTGLTQAAEGDTLVQGTGASALTGLSQAAEGDVLIQAVGSSLLEVHGANQMPPLLHWTVAGGSPTYDSATGVWSLPFGASIDSPLVPCQGHLQFRHRFDAQTNGASTTFTPLGGWVQSTFYYAADGVSPATNFGGYTGNGNAQSLALDTWEREAWTYYLGEEVHFIKFRVSNTAPYGGSGTTLQVRDSALYFGEADGSFPGDSTTYTSFTGLSAAEGDALAQGTAASALTALTQAAEGDALAQGTGASALSGLTQAATGTVLAQGTGDTTLSALTQAATGTVGDPQLYATGASTLASLTQAAEGDALVAGSAASALAALEQAATGELVTALNATGASVLSALEQAAVAEVVEPPSWEQHRASAWAAAQGVLWEQETEDVWTQTTTPPTWA